MNELKQTYSQIGQDLYVLSHITEPGFYLEIGAFDPINISNTYLLEKKGWKGFSFDISAIPTWEAERSNPLVQCDALTFNFEEFLDKNDCPKVMEYLSWDIDYEHVGQLKSLFSFPWHKYSFKVITIEHDAYRVNPEIRTAMRSLLTAQGYHLDRPDQTFCAQEDWWLLK